MTWISVKDRLPEYTFQIMGRQSVVVLITDGAIVCEGDLTDGIFHMLGVPYDKITHWMPLPDPPEKEA